MKKGKPFQRKRKRLIYRRDNAKGYDCNRKTGYGEPSDFKDFQK